MLYLLWNGCSTIEHTFPSGGQILKVLQNVRCQEKVDVDFADTSFHLVASGHTQCDMDFCTRVEISGPKLRVLQHLLEALAWEVVSCLQNLEWQPGHTTNICDSHVPNVDTLSHSNCVHMEMVWI